MSNKELIVMAEEARKKVAANKKAKAAILKAEKAEAKEAAKQAERERREQERAAKKAAKEAEKEREKEERLKSAYGKPSANTLEEALNDDGTYSARDIGRMCQLTSWNQINSHLTRAAARFDFEVNTERVLGPSILPRQDQRLDLKGVAALAAVANHVPKDIQEAVADVDLSEEDAESFFDENYPFSARELCAPAGIAWQQAANRLTSISQRFPDEAKETKWVSPSGRVLSDVRLTTKAATLFLLNLSPKTPDLVADLMSEFASSDLAENFLSSEASA